MPPPQHVLSTPSSRSINKPARVACVDPRSSLTFTHFQNMKRHAAQFHKLRADGSPATEAEHESAVLKAAERMAWASGVHARCQVRAQTSVEAELTRIKERQQFGERPAFKTRRTVRIRCHVPPVWWLFIVLLGVRDRQVQLSTNNG